MHIQQELVPMSYPSTRQQWHPSFGICQTHSQLAHKWEQKYRNLIITGSANWGKPFLLRPIEDIFKIISNLASEKYGTVGVEKAEVMFLNDFRWTSDLIQQNNFPLLLEGRKVHLYDPKNSFTSDLFIEKTSPYLLLAKNLLSILPNITVPINEKIRR